MQLVKRTEAPKLPSNVAPNGGERDGRDVFHTSFDPETESVVDVVVESIAAIQNEGMEELDPLHAVIDPEALDDLITGDDVRSGVDELTFSYEGMDVLVESGGDMWLQWQ